MLCERNHCPAELSEIAEAYVMNTLDRADAAVLTEHLTACSACAVAVEDADRYVRAMKIAARRLRATTTQAAFIQSPRNQAPVLVRAKNTYR